MRILFFLVIVLSVISCKNREVDQKIMQTDSLLTVVRDAQMKFKSIDTIGYRAIFKKVKSVNEIFQEYTKELSKESSFINKFAEYTMLQKDYKRYFFEYSRIENEIEYTKKQLNDFKTDLHKKAIKENEKIIQYFNQEVDAIKRLQLRIDEISLNGENYKKAYGRISSEIEIFAEKIKKNKK